MLGKSIIMRKHSLKLAKKDIEEEESWSLTVKKNEKKTGQTDKVFL